MGDGLDEGQSPAAQMRSGVRDMLYAPPRRLPRASCPPSLVPARVYVLTVSFSKEDIAPSRLVVVVYPLALCSFPHLTLNKEGGQLPLYHTAYGVSGFFSLVSGATYPSRTP